MSCLSFYLSKISKYPVLTDKEIRSLIVEFHNGSKEAKEKIINHNLRLVVKIARNFEKSDEDKLCDLIQEGTIGLMRAIEKFDLEKNVLFSTFSYRWIQSKISDSFSSSVQASYVPMHIKRAARKIESIEKELSLSLNKENIVNQVFEAYNLEIDKPISFNEFIRIRALNGNYLSTNYTLSEDNGTTIQDTLESDDDLENIATSKELEKWIKLKVSQLPENQKEAVQGYFGINRLDELKLKEIGAELGCSGSRAQQLVVMGVKKLKEIAKNDEIEAAII